MLLACRFDGANFPPASFLVQWHEGGGCFLSQPLSAGEIVALDVQYLEPDVLAKQEAGRQAPGRQEFIAEQGRRVLVSASRFLRFNLGSKVPGIQALATN
jgi:hypothetical protein